MKELKIIYKNITDIRPYPNNPRDNAPGVDAVAASIREFGFKVPVIIDHTGEIVAGHTRILAAEQLGLEKVPCIIADDLTEAQIKAFRIADNQTASLTGWNEELLSVELDALADMDFDLSITGFSDIEIGELLNLGRGGVTEDQPPDPPEEPTTKPGDLWLLGRHRLLCGDATDPEKASKLMENQLADMIFTDPPYNVDYTGKTKDALTIKNDAMEDKNFRNFLVAAFKNMVDASKAGAPIYVCHADSEGLTFRSAFKEAGWDLKQCIIWVKQHFVMGRQDYHWQHEPILYGWKPGAAHKFYGGRKQSTVWQIDRPMASREHPTMKPVNLCAKAIENSSKSGDIIIDFFGGSGSTLIACEQLNRTCYMMELDPIYCDVIVKRWENFTGKKAQLSE